ncbi:hypothetical protein [Luteolibacter sp. Populi]|uniref:hypothetical protein n=1 Tax=Luteolibacter sp. Populi TaxID=3230487 RepID=UPI0034672868
MTFFRALKSHVILCGCLFLAAPIAGAQSLLKAYPLEGDVRTTYWTFLASQNPYRIPNSPTTMKGTMVVAPPGYGASMGLYSWTGNYSMTVKQAVNPAPTFRIHHVVFQLDATWDPATTFPFNGGPKLSFNDGNQQLAATLPMIVDGTRVVDNETGIPEMEGIDSFAYRGITWQWDLSAVAGGVNNVSIQMPFANHTSVVGARIDIASAFQEIGAPVTALQQWRQTHFQTMENAGAAADDADYDRDGLPNLVEYGLGTSPVAWAGARPAMEMEGGRLSLSFALPVSPSAELRYRVQATDVLTGWTTLATKFGTQPWVWNGSGSSRVVVTPSGGKSLVTVGDEVSGAPKRQMRLEITPQ